MLKVGAVIFMFVLIRDIFNFSVKSFVFICFISLLSFGFLLGGSLHNSAHAERLGKSDCKVLKDKLKALKAVPAVMNMAKGFEWVKENIKGDDLLPIKDYLETTEQHKFRCPQPRVKKKKKIVKKKIVKKAVASKKKSIQLPQKKTTSKPKKVKIKKTKKKIKAKKSSLIKPEAKEEPGFFDNFFASADEEAPVKKSKKAHLAKKHNNKTKKPIKKPDFNDDIANNPFF